MSSIGTAPAESEITSSPTASPSPLAQCEQALLDAAQVCHDIYAKTDHGDTLNVVLRPDLIREMVDAVAAAGHSVIDGDQTLNMQNPDPLMEFGSGKTARAAWYTVYSDGHIGLSILTRDTITSLSARFTEEPSIYAQTEYTLNHVTYTEKGWLIYKRDQSASTNPKQFNIDPHTMIRVTPLSEEYRSLCDTYIKPIGYSENNLFTTDWSEADFSQVDFSSLYAMLFGMSHKGENLTQYTAQKHYAQIENSTLFLIPAQDFEAIVRGYFNISTSALRSGSDYNAGQEGYYFLGWHTGYYDVVPRIPEPEVVDARTNDDGTLTMVVDALYSWHGTDRAFSHEVTVRINTDGSFQYVSNRVIPQDSSIFPERKLQTLRANAIARLLQ